mmetsp:Transcript_22967/g.52595  ORF Transcript_22967/g.52595 Transcript_22967/m.52595 type:complete len:100 (-) Transcript_22967:390-689(-)
MIIGSHELTGRFVPMSKPLTVIRKRKRQAKFTELREDIPSTDPGCAKSAKSAKFCTDASDNVLGMQLEKHNSQTVVYEVVGMVKKKILFDKYPKAIMSV